MGYFDLLSRPVLHYWSYSLSDPQLTDSMPSHTPPAACLLAAASRSRAGVGSRPSTRLVSPARVGRRADEGDSPRPSPDIDSGRG